MYSTNVELLVQQKDSRFLGKTREGTAVGSQMAPVDQVGTLEVQPVTTRFAPIVRSDAPTDRRWVFPIDRDLAQQVDTFDKLRTMNDIQGPLTMTASAAFGRAYDDEIIRAFTDTAFTGTRGGTPTIFLAANQIAVNFKAAGNVGATVAKMIEAKRILMAHEVDVMSEDLYYALDALQHSKLLNEIPIISRDYNSKPALDGNGMITSWLGFMFVHSERLLLNGSGHRRTIAWAKSGMHFCRWGGFYSSVDQRKDLQGHPWQLYSKATYGSTRIEEKKIVEVICVNS
jgi:hypothetical protein